MNKFEEELEKIKIEKEILETLPRNNVKNLKNSYKKFEEVHRVFLDKKDLILKEMEKRFNKSQGNNKKSSDIQILEEKVSKMEEILYILNDVGTSCEKMGLGENIHDLKFFYMKDLNLVNQNILECIQKFKKVGVELSPADFVYNKYVNEYLNVFFENIKELKNIKLKENFEKIYWKCPEIITYIELNIRYLFFKNEKKIDKYYEDYKQKKLKANNNILKEYNILKKELINIKILDERTLINEFFNGNLNIKEYTKEKMLSDLSKFVSKEILNEYTDKKIEELNLEMIKLVDTLNEYRIYSKYKFIIDDINDVYKKKEKNKKIYDKTKKEIYKKEIKVLKLNKKGFFNKSEEKNLTKQTALILELKDLYNKLDKYKVYYKIETKINENSTLFDLLYLGMSFYDYMFDCISEQYKEMSEEEIKNMIEELKVAITNPNYNIINNITINENKNIVHIIKDKYQLSNISMTKDDLEEDNLDNLILSLKKYENYYNILKNKIDSKEINELCEFNKILKDK